MGGIPLRDIPVGDIPVRDNPQADEGRQSKGPTQEYKYNILLFGYLSCCIWQGEVGETGKLSHSHYSVCFTYYKHKFQYNWYTTCMNAKPALDIRGINRIVDYSMW